ncbi:MAG: nitroreductase family protein [Promethearchaeati archaeon SRVP18_Atabeyarchaeia-1]
MDLYEAVGRRRSVREFESSLVEEEKLRRVLEAGLRAPSHNHLREWEFILVRDPAQRRRVVEIGARARNMTNQKELEEATTGMKDELQQEMYLKALSVQKRMLVSAPELLVVCFKMRKPLEECTTLYDLNCFASIWTCIENILLAMASEGLYGVTYVPNGTSSLRDILGVPEDYEIAALIPIGYPRECLIKQKEISLRDKLHTDEW